MIDGYICAGHTGISRLWESLITAIEHRKKPVEIIQATRESIIVLGPFDAVISLSGGACRQENCRTGTSLLPGSR